MEALDYPPAIAVGRREHRRTFWARPHEVLIGFRPGVSDEVKAALILEHFAPTVLGADTEFEVRIELVHPPLTIAGEPTLAFEHAIGGSLAARLWGKDMAWVQTRADAFARDAARGFLEDVGDGVAWLASPVYEPAIGASPAEALVPWPSTLIVGIPDPGDDVAIGEIEDLGLRRDPDWPEEFGNLKRFHLRVDDPHPHTNEPIIADDGFDLLAHVRAVPGVSLAEFDWLRLDPLEGRARGMSWNRRSIGLGDVTPARPGRRRVTIAVIDTGFDLQHPDMAGVYTPRRTHRCFPGASTGSQTPTNDVQVSLTPTPATPDFLVTDDWRWHGTAVAGVLAAASVPQRRVAGVAGGSRILPIRVEEPISDSNVAAALRWATSQKIRVANISLSSGTPHSALRDAVADAFAAGMIICAAAGNLLPDEHPRVIFPAAFPEVIAVGACVEDGSPKDVPAVADERWFSAYGPELSVLAPGVRIRTTDARGDAGYNLGGPGREVIWYGRTYRDNEAGDGGGDYLFAFTGTSAATPHVAGLAALLLTKRRNLSNEKVREIIESTARKVGGEDGYPFGDVYDRPELDTRWSAERGYGLIDVPRALDRA